MTLLVKKGLEPLLEDFPDADRIRTWEPGSGRGWRAILRLSARLRRDRYDAVVIFNPSRLFHAASFLAGIPVRIGYRRKLGALLTRSIPDTKHLRSRHEAEYNLELAQLAGAVCEPITLSIPVPQRKREEVCILLPACAVEPGPGAPGIVGLHPWTSNPAKAWPLERFEALASRLAGHGITVWVVGEPEHRSQHFDGKELVGKIPLRLLPAVLQRCAVLVSNDSGPVHVAAAVGTATVVVASRSHARQMERWRPLGERHAVLTDPTPEQALQAVREWIGQPCEP